MSLFKLKPFHFVMALAFGTGLLFNAGARASHISLDFSLYEVFSNSLVTDLSDSPLSTFVALPTPDQGIVALVYAASISVDPGWTFDGAGGDISGLYSYGARPDQSPTDPNAGPPQGPVLVVNIFSDNLPGLYAGGFSVSAYKSDDTNDTETVTARFRVFVGAPGTMGPVPEPSTALMLGLGAITSLGALTRARRRA